MNTPSLSTAAAHHCKGRACTSIASLMLLKLSLSCFSMAEFSDHAHAESSPPAVQRQPTPAKAQPSKQLAEIRPVQTLSSCPSNLHLGMILRMA
jgi:hypothetical protein